MMTIEQAKKQIKQAVAAYLTVNEYGRPIIPLEKQRPVILMGPPGVGKTAIMEQIAGEMGIGLVSYSMTHHTRQSALGLPYIEDQTFCGNSYKVSLYTMSEIIAEVYKKIEHEDCPRGILFLDEINCVSETLAPSMLQFLQYKTFGTHRLPEGWVVVTAGNPQEYNDSARDFDVVTWDRLKRIDIAPDFGAWKKFVYTSAAGVHPAIVTFLDTYHAEAFYSVETTPEGKRFVTPRGWNDLSAMMNIFESKKFDIDYDLIRQYIQNDQIASKFKSSYELYLKYSGDYKVEDILAGKVSDHVKEKAKAVKKLAMTHDEKRGEALTECFGIVNMIVAALYDESRQQYIANQAVGDDLKKCKDMLSNANGAYRAKLDAVVAAKRTELDKGEKSGSMGADKKERFRLVIKFLESLRAQLVNVSDDEAFAFIKNAFSEFEKNVKAEKMRIGSHIDNAYMFIEEVFGKKSTEIEILTNDLTGNNYYNGPLECAHKYYEYCGLLFNSKRTDNLRKDITVDFTELN